MPGPPGKLQHEYDIQAERLRQHDRRRLAAARVERFSLVSDSCWGGAAYAYAGCRFDSPFIGLFIVPQCFDRLVHGLESHLESQLVFQKTTAYPQIELR